MKLITFDFLNTLVKLRAPVGQLYSVVAKRYGRFVDPAKLDQSFKAAYKATSKEFPNFGYGQLSSEDWWAHVTTRTFDGLESPLTKLGVQALYSAFSTNEFYELYPETRVVLQDLRRTRPNLKIGIISNSDERVHSVVNALRMSNLVNFTLTAKETGFMKPDARIFAEALRRADARPHEAMHIGDDVPCDYEGARAAGWKALLVARNGLTPDLDGVSSDDLIPDLMPLHSLYNAQIDDAE
eukprot:TRINITY_DN23227_c0_g1_i1.p1 TRINITY_DN23227_c0_g1~~TRINITY_DN23227_c0_g1_i1.p1  ORF type:complete len:240 (+),score=8.70 TRINITY_DN23227_c0_g1_i1:68-787(+)